MDNDLSTRALRALRRILRAADLAGRRLAAATGLTPSQLLVLQEIERRGETTPSAIAAALQFGQATITNIVDRLERSGLVSRQRSEKDRRQIFLRATPAGREAIEAAPDMLQQQFRERFPALEGWEQAMILAALERLSGVLDADAIDAAPLLDTGAIDRGALD
jgi:DNA-binding MarR family transcriptional regulator